MNLRTSISRTSALKRCLSILLGICVTLTLILLILLRQAEAMKDKRLNSNSKQNPEIDNKNSNDTLIDFEGFQFLEQNYKLCHTQTSAMNNKTISNSNNLLLILILSSPENINYRNIIRKSWGSLGLIGNWNIKYAFLIGTSKNSNTDTNNDLTDQNNKITQESIQNQDLIVGNFIDSYKNLSYKQIMGYKWALRYCKEAKFILKTDDDVFIDTFQLVNYLDSLIYHNKIIVGYVNYNSSPQRTKGGKWLVTMDEYSADTYPDYCMGMGFIMSFDVVNYLYEASEMVPYFWVEDVYVTGILREYVQNVLEIDLNMIDLSKKYIFSDGIDDIFMLWLYNEKCSGMEFPWIFVHCWGEEISVHFYQLWKFVLKLNNQE